MSSTDVPRRRGNRAATASAVVPVAIAMLGATVGAGSESTTTSDRVRMTRAAANVRTAVASLTDAQQGALAMHNPLGRPTTKLPGNRTLVVRTSYTLGHNNIDKIADWVSYKLTKAFVTGDEERKDDFKPDPLLRRGSRAELDDYLGFKGVYDRGHQIAAGDSKGRGDRIMSDSFFLSNMTPQSAKLNRGRWRTLEMKVQEWARKGTDVWVVTGPAFVDDDSDGVVDYFVIGGNRVAVPTHYYKIVLREKDTGDATKTYEALAFLIPNERMEKKHKAYLASIDEVEEATGYDFFPDVEEGTPAEEAMEGSAATALWK